MNSKIITVVAQTDLVSAFAPDAYRLNASGRFAFLSRWLWAALDKLGALKTADDKRKVVSTHRFDADSVVENIFKQKHEAMRDFDAKPYLILIGCEDFNELIGAGDFRQMMTFRSERALRFDAEFIGVDVMVVPWISGVVVLGKRGRDAAFGVCR